MPSQILVSRVRTALVLAALSVAPVSGQEGRLCGTCKTTGVVDIEISSKGAIELESGPGWAVLHCTDAIDGDNLGLDWMPCPRCKSPEMQAQAQARWDALAAEKRAWSADRRKMDRFTSSDNIAHLETTHYVIAWDPSKHTASDKKNYRAHEAAHLYARRMEEFLAHYQELLGVTDAHNMVDKHHIYVFEKLSDAQPVGQAYAGLTSSTTARRAGGVDHDSTLVIYRDKNSHPKDQDLHRHFIHSMVHQLTSVHFVPEWFLDGGKPLSPPWLADKYGWLDAGLAHWFEMDFDGTAATYCMQEQNTSGRWKGGDWKKNIFKAVSAGDVPSFAEVITLPTQALSPLQHQFAWSWVDYLMNLDPKGMGNAVKWAKHGRPVRDILMDCWNVSMLGFEERWTAWVLVEYDPNKKS